VPHEDDHTPPAPPGWGEPELTTTTTATDEPLSPPQAPAGPEPLAEADADAPTTSPQATPSGERERERERGTGGRRDTRSGTARHLVRRLPSRSRADVAAGAMLHLLVLASSPEDTTAVDLSSGAILRLRVPWPDGHPPDLAMFDVVETTLASDPEHDDLAQPEAATVDGLPRQVGTLRGRRVRRLLDRLVAVPDGPLLGFAGPAAPYWEFRGHRPSVALVEPTRGPQLIKRRDDSTWVRFGWQRDDVWLPVEDRHAIRSLHAARRERLAGKDLATAIGFRPEYLLVSLTQPRDGHCYKVLTAVLPRG
jgi:hypothetical protein